jgi:hypothetical protein
MSSWRRHRGFTPVLSTAGVALLVIATLVAFLVFANGTARLLRVQYLVERIADETCPALTDAVPTGVDAVEVVRPQSSAAGVPIRAPTHGVIDAVDIGGLAALAARSDGWIEVTRRSAVTSGPVPSSRTSTHPPTGPVPPSRISSVESATNSWSPTSAASCWTPASACASSSTSRVAHCLRR